MKTKEILYDVSISVFAENIGINRDRVFRFLREHGIVEKSIALPTEKGSKTKLVKRSFSKDGRAMMKITKKGSNLVYNSFVKDGIARKQVKNEYILNALKEIEVVEEVVDKSKINVLEEYIKELLTTCEKQSLEIRLLQDRCGIKFVPNVKEYYHYIDTNFNVITDINEGSQTDILRIQTVRLFREVKSALLFLSILKGESNENFI